MRSAKWILLVIIFSLLLASCSKSNSTSFLGYIEGRYVYLSSSESGNLVQLAVHKGQTVESGQLAFQLDPQPQQSSLESAKSDLAAAEHDLENLKSGERDTILKRLDAQVAQAQADLKFATVTYQRNKKLRETDVVSQSLVDESLARYQTDTEKLRQANENLAEAKLGARSNLILAQESKMQSAQNNVNRLQWMLEQKTVKIPQAGFIENTFYRQNEFVPAGKPIVSLLPPQNRLLIFYVPETQLSRIKMGQTVYFKYDGSEKLVSADINYISSQAEYTPPVIYSKDSREKLVYWIEAAIDPSLTVTIHPGQPVEVTLGQ